MNLYHLAITVEGIGISGATDRQIRFATASYAGDSDSCYIPALVALPRAVEASVDFRAGRLSVGGTSFTLRASDLVRGWLMRGDVPRRVGLLAVEIDDADTTLEIQTDSPADLAGADILIGREVIRLGNSYSGSGPYSFASSTRGRWGTTAYAHPISPRRAAVPDVQVFLASHFTVALHRVVTLIRVPQSGTGYGDEEVLGRWVLSGVSGGLEDVVIDCDDVLELVNARTILPRQARLRRVGSTNNFEGDAPLTYQGGADGTDQALFLAGGKTGIRALWSGDSISFPVRGAVYLDTTFEGFASFHVGSPVLLPEDLDAITEITEVFSTHPDAPDLNADGGRLSTNLLDLLRQLLTTTDASSWGAAGTNGAYDLGIGLLGCAVPDSLIDHDSFDAAKLALGPLAEVPALYLTKPEGAYDLLARLCRLVSGSLVRGEGGTIGFAYYRTTAEDGAPTLGEGDLTASPYRYDPGRTRPADTVVAVFDERLGLEALTVPFIDAYAGERYPTARAAEERLDLRGIGGEGADGAMGEARARALRWLGQWRYHPPLLDVEALPAASILALKEGRTCLLTHGLIPSRDGSRGVEDCVCLVTSHTYDLDKHTVALRLLLVGIAVVRSGLIAPAAVMASRVGSVVTVGTDFSASLLEGQTNDTHGFTVGDPVLVRTRDRGTTRGTTTITAINAGASTITLNAVPAGMTAGDIITLRDYDNQSAGNQDTYASLADTDGLVGTALDDGFEWGG